MGKSKKKSFYGVKIGRQTGIFTSWDGPNGASSSVTGFPGALFQGFQTRAEAEKYIAQDVNQTRGATKKGTASSSSRSAPAALVATAPAPVPAPAVTATRRTRTATTDSQDHFNDGLNEELLSDELDNTTEDYLAAISRPPLAPSPEAPVAAADARRPVVDMDSDNEVPNTPPPPYSTQPPAILAQTTFNTASTSGYLVNPVRSTPSTTMDKLAVSSSQNAPLETAVPSIEEQEKPVTPPPPPLSEEQQRALDLTLAGRNIFLTGPGGTGKSFLIDRLCQALEAPVLGLDGKQIAKGKSVHRTATTGIAALNIRGLTIHSWAGIDRGLEDPHWLAGRLCSTTMRKAAFLRWVEADVLIIDEISMFSDQMLEVVEQVGRSIRQKCVKDDVAWEILGISKMQQEEIKVKLRNICDRPFGGIQVILSGDFFQLPPVDRGKWKSSDYSKYVATQMEQQNEKQKGPQRILRESLRTRPKFAFEGALWPQLNLTMVELCKVFRQDDAGFVKILNKLRIADVDTATINCIKRRHQPPPPELRDKITNLFARNKDADDANEARYKQLAGPERRYVAKDACRREPESMDYFKMLHELTCHVETRLKVGTRVMLLHNIDTSQGLVNGQTGTIISFQPANGKVTSTRYGQMKLGHTDEEDHTLRAAYNDWYVKNQIVVPIGGKLPGQPDFFAGTKRGKKYEDEEEESDGDEQDDLQFWATMLPTSSNPSGGLLPCVKWDNNVTSLVDPQHWTVEDHHGHLRAWRVQLPLRLAWAFSIHKSQGLSLDAVQADVFNCFDDGMAYVALSRCRKLQTLFIPKPFQAGQVKASKDVMKFYIDHGSPLSEALERQMNTASPPPAWSQSVSGPKSGAMPGQFYPRASGGAGNSSGATVAGARQGFTGPEFSSSPGSSGSSGDEVKRKSLQTKSLSSFQPASMQTQKNGARSAPAAPKPRAPAKPVQEDTFELSSDDDDIAAEAYEALLRGSMFSQALSSGECSSSRAPAPLPPVYQPQPRFAPQQPQQQRTAPISAPRAFRPVPAAPISVDMESSDEELEDAPPSQGPAIGASGSNSNKINDVPSSSLGSEDLAQAYVVSLSNLGASLGKQLRNSPPSSASQPAYKKRRM